MSNISINKISFTYKNGGDSAAVFYDASFEIPCGKITAILGKSGCGKSTLIKLISGLYSPDSGEIKYPSELHSGEGKFDNYSIVFQDHGLFPWKKVRDNILMPEILSDASHDENKYDEVIREFGLEDTLKKYPTQLSGGQRSRVSIARSILSSKKLILMDEPFAALDDATKDIVRGYTINHIRNNNLTMVIVTHDNDEANLVADKIIRL